MPTVKRTYLRRTNRIPYLIATAIIILVVAIIAILELTNVTHLFHTSQTRKNALETAKSDNARKKALTEQNNQNSSGKATPAPTTYTPPNNPNDIVIAPTQSGDTVTIMTKLYHYSSGTCALHITNGSHTYDANAQVIFETQFSTCAGFSVPVSKLGTGDWNITLNVSSSNITQTQTATIKVQ